MATTGTAFNAIAKAVSANVYKTKNASCILGITSASDTGNVSEVLTIQNSSYNQGKNNGRNALNDSRHVLALSGGVFQFQSTNSQWVMLAGNVTRTLSGTANLTLISGAGDFRRRGIPFKTTARISHVTGIAWVSTELEGPVFTISTTATTLDFGNDVAANLTRANRSSAFYMVKGTLATETSYTALTLW